MGFGNEGMRRRKWAGERGGQTGVTYSVPAAGAAASSELGRRGEAGPGVPALRRRAGAAQWWAPMRAFRKEGCSERKQYQTISK